jgi:CheY-like chemotaxis protein
VTTVLIAGAQLKLGIDLMHTLERLGFTVPAVVGSAEQLITGVLTLDPDVVLTDIDLRGPRDGIDVAKEIHERTRVPVVFYTPSPDDVSIARLQEAPLFALLALPIRDDLLRETLERAAIASHAAPKRSGAVPRFSPPGRGSRSSSSGC